MGGLFPDWSYSDGRLAGAYGYEACRVPWRLAMDLAWHDSERARQLLGSLSDYIELQGGLVQAASAKNSCFLGGFALAAMSRDQNTLQQWYRQWLQSVPQSPTASVGDNPYYQGTLRVLYLLTISAELRL